MVHRATLFGLIYWEDQLDALKIKVKLSAKVPETKLVLIGRHGTCTSVQCIYWYGIFGMAI